MAGGSPVVSSGVAASWVRGVLRLWSCGLIAMIVCTLAVLSAESAHAATSIRIDITSCGESGSVGQVAGRVRTLDNQGIGSLQVTIYVDGAAQGTTATSSDGSFAFEFAKPGPGSHIVTVVWAGDARYNATQAQAHISVAQVVAPTLSLSLDPGTVAPKSSVAVTGSLTAGGAPVSSAVITLTTSYGSVDGMVATAGDGTFAAIVVIPDGGEFPASFTVAAAYAGDGLYLSAGGEASGAIAAPSPQPTTPAEAAPSPSTVAPSVAGSGVTPAMEADVLTRTESARADEAFAFSEEHGRQVTVVFGVVAAVAATVMIILGVVSHHNKRLANDERRGFGTSFGKAG